MFDPEALAMPYRSIEHPYAMAAGAGSSVAAAVMAVGQTASDVAGAVPSPGLTVGAWIAAATAVSAFGGQIYSQWRSARRQQDAADAQASLDRDTREHETWGGKYEVEMGRRVQAEARLQLAEEQIQRLTGQNAVQAKEMEVLGEKVQALSATTTASVTRLKGRVASVEAQQGSTSAIDIPVTPPPPPPKTGS